MHRLDRRLGDDVDRGVRGASGPSSCASCTAARTRELKKYSASAEAVDERREVEQLADSGAGHGDSCLPGAGRIVGSGRAGGPHVRGRVRVGDGGTRGALLLPDLRGRVRDRRDGRRRPGRAGARRRRPPGVARVHVLARAAASPAWHHRADAARPAAAARDATSGGTTLLDDLAAVLRDTVDGPRRRRGRALPRHRAGLRRRRPDRGGPFLGVAREPLLLHRGHRRQRAGARRRRAGDRQRDAEPALGSDRARARSCSSAPTRSSPTVTARRCPIRSATSATTGASADACGCSTRGAPRPRRSPTSTSRSGPAPTSCVLAALAGALLDRRRRRRRAPRLLRRPTTSPRCAPRSRPFTIDRAAAARRRRPGGARRRWSTTCARTAAALAIVVRHRRDDGDRRHPRRMAALGAAHRSPGSLDRPGGMRFHRGASEPPAPAATDAATGAARAPPAGPSCPGCVRQVPAVALADEIEAGQHPRAGRDRRQPARRVPEPDRVRAALAPARRARRRRRHRERAHRARHPRAARHRAARTGRHLDVLAPARCARRCSRPGGRRPRRPTDARCGGCSRQLAARARRRPARRRRSRRARPTRSTCAAIARPLTARRRRVFAAGPRGFDLAGRARLGPRDDAARRPLAARADPAARPARRPPRAGRRAACSRPRREMAWSNSVRYGADDRPTGSASIPTTRARPGWTTAARATVVTAHGSLDVTVVVDRRARPARRGLAWCTAGAAESPGVLLSTREGIDPLTTMPHASGVPVTIEPT